MNQLELLKWTPPVILGDRDGETFSIPRDRVRLNAQAQDVFDHMEGGHWVTLQGLSWMTGHPEASISARLRDLRKPKFGGYKIEKRNLGGGTWQYRLGQGANV